MEEQVDLSKVDVIVDRYRDKKGSLIKVLNDIQEEYYYLPEQALRKVAEGLDVPLSRIYSVATFYSAFSLSPRGRHLVHVCVGTTCYVRGSDGLLAAARKDLGIDVGGISQDKQFSLETIHCLGCCSIAPVIKVDENAHGRLMEDKVPSVLRQYY
jgi:NADH:ubiquinone oxidoreductase subunit E